MRREGEAATALFRQAMQRAGYDQPKLREVLSLKRPERSIDLPWPEARTTPLRITIASIARDVAHRHGLAVADLRRRKKTHAVKRARHEAFYLARTKTNASLPQIGRYFGGRDHSTIINGIERHIKREGLR